MSSSPKVANANANNNAGDNKSHKLSPKELKIQVLYDDWERHIWHVVVINENVDVNQRMLKEGYARFDSKMKESPQELFAINDESTKRYLNLKRTRRCYLQYTLPFHVKIIHQTITKVHYPFHKLLTKIIKCSIKLCFLRLFFRTKEKITMRSNTMFKLKTKNNDFLN
ncbi:hypothetical protein RFI_23713 [Reticulomyxa filosa]|uniref:TNase-like domain-containing protein n=1 Tax=Reticulomyxa filosa TaxID=46433 RepID=X6MJN4_RETFI|nr:hypothetical protein RFI_23713 [Reticulomyxa filosa]|eukprot:ETO13657.1 hypothetical protein RFI_23713 [Reticulomyxa filosa]